MFKRVTFNTPVLSIIYASLKVNDRSKNNKNRLKLQKKKEKKMSILLDVFRFKSSTDQKGIMIYSG